MARLIKLLHELGSIGTLGAAAACLLFLHRGPEGVRDIAASGEAVRSLVQWLVVPSFIATILSGLLALVVTPAYLDSGWAWLKALLSLSLFEASLLLNGASKDAALLSQQAAAGSRVLEQLALAERTERGVLWVLLLVCLANVAIGIWRPRLARSRPAS